MDYSEPKPDESLIKYGDGWVKFMDYESYGFKYINKSSHLEPG
jgi:hypothetical protein